MASTLKVNRIETPDGVGNISFAQPISGDGSQLTDLNLAGSNLTNLPSANLVGALPILDGSQLTGVVSATIPDDSVTGAKIDLSLVSGDIIYADNTDSIERLAKGTNGQWLTQTGGYPAWQDAPVGGWTYHATGNQLTNAAASSAVLYGSFPAAVSMIKVIFHTVDGNGTGNFLHVKIGTASGLESTGYRGSTGGTLITAAGTHIWDSTSGFEIVDASTVADDYNGVLTLHRMNSGEHKWVGTSMVAGCPAQATDWSAGTKTLTGELTQLQIWSTVAFQDGSVNVIYM
tara:strand:- start:211 stop:1074 length:864 start_codon:yes stop_codon:yes gene_type:complete